MCIFTRAASPKSHDRQTCPKEIAKLSCTVAGFLFATVKEGGTGLLHLSGGSRKVQVQQNSKFGSDFSTLSMLDFNPTVRACCTPAGMFELPAGAVSSESSDEKPGRRPLWAGGAFRRADGREHA